MAEDVRRKKREMNAALDQIKKIQQRQEARQSRWRLDVSVYRMAAEGLGAFVIAFLVGCGLATLFNVLLA